jgi:uncharacterized membrane protein
MSASVPAGWHHNPSGWSSRLPALALALVGCGIAMYLMLYQVGAIAHVWEPFFGSGSHYILRESAIARHLPFPDAALGALAYLLEAVSECIGGRERWRRWPLAVYGTGAIAAVLTVAALFLIACQLWWFHHFCTLCLASAACSLAIAALVAPEVWAALRYSGFRLSARGSRGARAEGTSQPQDATT